MDHTSALYDPPKPKFTCVVEHIYYIKRSQWSWIQRYMTPLQCTKFTEEFLKHF
jgi:hypothetical protein